MREREEGRNEERGFWELYFIKDGTLILKGKKMRLEEKVKI